MKKTLFLVAGRAGSGKDAVVTGAFNRMGLKKIVSYTDAPIRDDQVEGREHFFVSKEKMDEILKNEEIIAYTKIGDNRYCATASQINDETKFYIIDPIGIKDIQNKNLDINLKIVYIYADLETRKKRMWKRKNFDADTRIANEEAQFNEFEESYGFDFMIDNNINLQSSIDDLCCYVYANDKHGAE